MLPSGIVTYLFTDIEGSTRLWETDAARMADAVARHDALAERFPDGASAVRLDRVRLRDLAAPEELWQLQHPDLRATFPPLRSLDTTPNNLPQQLTTFIGREQEIATVEQLLVGSRLVTLTGSGGCGNTCIALQVAQRFWTAIRMGYGSWSSALWRIRTSFPKQLPPSSASRKSADRRLRKRR